MLTNLAVHAVYPLVGGLVIRAIAGSAPLESGGRPVRRRGPRRLRPRPGAELRAHRRRRRPLGRHPAARAGARHGAAAAALRAGDGADGARRRLRLPERGAGGAQPLRGRPHRPPVPGPRAGDLPGAGPRARGPHRGARRAPGRSYRAGRQPRAAGRRVAGRRGPRAAQARRVAARRGPPERARRPRRTSRTCATAPRGALDYIEVALERTVKQLRDAVFDLHPSILEHAGLAAALDAVAEQQGRRGRFRPRVAWRPTRWDWRTSCSSRWVASC